MPHLALLGDSVFDNGAYVPSDPDVAQQLRSMLPPEWKVSLLAVDGAVVSDVAEQIAVLPSDTTHLAISAGGNDALRHSGILYQGAANVRAVLSQLADVQDGFRRDVRAMLIAAVAKRLPTIVCTIYDAIPGLGREAASALSIFNDVIVQEAARQGVSILDLRLIATEARYFSAMSPIEPSAAGGQRIAEALTRAITSADFGQRCSVYS
jgi:hypothetical protein